MKKTLCLSTLVLLTSSVAAYAQSPLAEAARREAARREALKTAATKTFTAEDLAKLPPRATPAVPQLPATEVTTIGPGGSATPQAAAKPAAPGAAAAAAGAEAVRDEKYWRDRITTARSNLSRAEIFAESLQSRINALSADLVNRDDPAQRQKIAEDRQRALDELARVQAEIAGFTQAVRDIEDEARRLNVPAGWLR